MQTVLHPAGRISTAYRFGIQAGLRLRKKTENNFVFGGNRQFQTRKDLPPPSSIQTVTVGSGVPPDPALLKAM